MWLIKTLLIVSSISSVFATYAIVKRWVDPNDIILEVASNLTTTSCVFKCRERTNCKTVGFFSDPSLSENATCYLLKNVTYEYKEDAVKEESIEFFVLLDEYDYSKSVIEKSLDIHQSCVYKENACLKKNCDDICTNLNATTAVCECTQPNHILDPNGKTFVETHTWKWPRGSYGILSKYKCPDNWFPFKQCVDLMEATKVNLSTLDHGPCQDATDGGSSMTFLYCFKGPNVPSREDGFRTMLPRYQTFVIQNVDTDCNVFGRKGGFAYLDLEDDIKDDTSIIGTHNPKYMPREMANMHPKNMQLDFCVIGEEDPSSNLTSIEIGPFEEVFGLFSTPDDSPCPALDSPKGILYGKKERMFLDLETGGSITEIDGLTPFKIDKNKDVAVAICVYNTTKGVLKGMNHALKKPSYVGKLRKGMVASRGNDGDINTYSSTDGSWYVDLEKNVSIDRVVVHTSPRKKKIDVFVGSSPTSWELCKKIENPKTQKLSTFDSTCDNNNKGKFVKIEMQKPCIVYEVEIYGNQV